MYILGLNSYHPDSSAALIKDGEIIAAAEEERFNREKHWSGFPEKAIHFCLSEGKISVDDLNYVCLNRNPRANLHRKLVYILRKAPSLLTISDRLKNRNKILNVKDDFYQKFGVDLSESGTKVCFVEHHRAHIASSFFVSSFNDAALISVDGFGDFASTFLAYGNNKKIEPIAKVYYPHSLGIFYLALTQYLGFSNYGDEYKVMGLASYGKPQFTEEMREIVKVKPNGLFELNLKMFRHETNGFEMSWNNTIPKIGRVYSESLEDLLGSARKPGSEIEQIHKNIAASLQLMYEEAFFSLLNRLYENTKVDRLCLSGGCAMNSVANGKIFELTPFKDIYIQPAAGDAGGAIGAAYSVYNDNLNTSKNSILNHAFLGPGFENDEIEKLLSIESERIFKHGCEIEFVSDNDELCRKTAKSISNGAIVGWFQGRMEWGPRALGNRSIVCDPRRANIREILNLKIKRRESFRPFAPAILRESVSEYFETDYDVPFMLQVYGIRENKRDEIPAVTHIDGTGRLQTVTKEHNDRFWKLIEEFRKLTGIPILLNTSFNENEPIVCKPEEALECFLRTKMDLLVLNNYLIYRKG